MHLRIIPVLLVAFTLVFAGCASNPPANTVQNTNTGPPTTVPPNTPVPPVLPPVGTMEATISPEAPVAGDDITVTATLLSQYDYPGWENDTEYSIWTRQFGNWKVTPCTDSPCSAVVENVSAGNFEYQIHREDSAGKDSLDGAFSLTIESGIKTGDTIGPKVVVFYTPAHPKAGESVEITASVEDISSLEKVEVYFDGSIVKTCPQKVKISQCSAEVTNLVVGAHTYSARAVDSYGNETQVADATLVVDAS